MMLGVVALDVIEIPLNGSNTLAIRLTERFVKPISGCPARDLVFYRLLCHRGANL
jgi:hypothetical protein